MRIGVFQHGWWEEACRRGGHEGVPLPIAQHPSGNAYCVDLAGRLAHAPSVLSLLAQTRPDVLLDNGGTGLSLVADRNSPEPRVNLMHEVAGVPLCSHFIDPITTALQGIDFPTLWQSLQSRTWVKAVWDKAHAQELAGLGVPQVMHLPMAAPDRDYDTRPLDAAQCRPVASFVGGQNTSYFRGSGVAPTPTLLAGTIAQAALAEDPRSTFFGVWQRHGFGRQVRKQVNVPDEIVRAADYFQNKLFYHAGLCIRNRDRFVIRLALELGERFELIGQGWTEAYGINALPQIATDEYFKHFRDTAINLNFVNGNAETGLNMRHFEITAAGGFMLCHAQPELVDCFVIGKECAVFTSEADLFAKIDYYMGRPQERAEIAQAGQRRTLSQHLYRHRLRKLIDAIAPAQLPITYSTTDWKDDLLHAIPQADVILDCGANTGQMAEALRGLYPKAEIYSFEPVSSPFEELSRRCKALRVHAVKAAVGDRNGKATIHLTTGSEAHSLLPYQEGNPCAQWTWVTGHEEVDLVTLDEWCRQKGIDGVRVSVIKLDVQGSELMALYGASRLLRNVKAIFLEVCFVPIYQGAPLFAEVDRFLGEAGFVRYAIYPSDQPHNWGDALYVRR